MFSLNDAFLNNYIKPYDPINNLGICKHISRLGLGSTDVIIAEGNFDTNLVQHLKDNRRIVAFEAEHPNGFATGEDFIKRQVDLHRLSFKIYTICPFTATWLNKILGGNKYIPTFFPIDGDFVSLADNEKKVFDVIYTGHAGNPAHISNDIEFVKQIFKFRYAWLSGVAAPGVTHIGGSYLDKLRLIAQGKISLVHNRLTISDMRAQKIMQIPAWKSNEAFREISNVQRPITAPQIKTRVFESALCGSLILCLRDNWNIIERFFEPNVDFLYFDESTNLSDFIQEILSNFDRYAPLVANARQKVLDRYTTKQFVKNIFLDCA
jgi:hypothetical protein